MQYLFTQNTGTAKLKKNPPNPSDLRVISM